MPVPLSIEHLNHVARPTKRLEAARRQLSAVAENLEQIAAALAQLQGELDDIGRRLEG